MENIVLKVSSKSNSNSVAGALVAMIKETKKVDLDAVGAGAVNQALKAVAIANSFVAPQGTRLVCIPAFTDVILENQYRTGMKLIVKEEA